MRRTVGTSKNNLTDGFCKRPDAARRWITTYGQTRHCDPPNGRFTQEDPIGLAGGLNLYGFGGGDPVNYQDPFGLTGCKDAKSGKDLSDAQCVPEDKPAEKVTADIKAAKLALEITTRVGAAEGLLEEGFQLYHRLESPTQTAADALAQQTSGEIWGSPARWSDIPSVKAYTGPLPAGARGIEFGTDVLPDRHLPPGQAKWTGPRAGVRVENDRAKICAIITKNTQC